MLYIKITKAATTFYKYTFNTPLAYKPKIKTKYNFLNRCVNQPQKNFNNLRFIEEAILVMFCRAFGTSLYIYSKA